MKDYTSDALDSGTESPDTAQPEDFYFDDNGLMVMTEAYHLKRGTCCGSKCRHCPYDHENVPEKD